MKISSIVHEERPCAVLHKYSHLLPKEGKALDLACGRGRNAIFLAERGLDVDAVDISVTAIGGLKKTALNKGLKINAIVRDIELRGLIDQLYNVIVVSNFLNRDLFPQIINHLLFGGILFYQTWTVEKPDKIGPKNPDYLLHPNELLELCKGMRVLYFEDEGQAGSHYSSMIVAYKPESVTSLWYRAQAIDSSSI